MKRKKNKKKITHESDETDLERAVFDDSEYRIEIFSVKNKKTHRKNKSK
jgi:hypothetical protein